MRLACPDDSAAIERLVETFSGVQPNYPTVGGSLRGECPAGFRYDCCRARLGTGVATFGRAVVGLQTWRAHLFHGVRVIPQATRVETGATVLVALGWSQLAIVVPCRVVGVIDEAARWGFAYGSLPGHLEQGEEAFVVSIAEDGSVAFEISSFSRPADRLLRLSGPFGRILQRAGSHGYLRALRRYVDQSTSPHS